MEISKDEQVILDEIVEAAVEDHEFHEELKILYLKLGPSAGDSKKNECCSSAHCCYTLPGSLAEEDVLPIANHLGITPEQLFKTFLTVTFNYEEFRLLPIRKGMTPGGYTSMVDNRVAKPCIFLSEKNECLIHEVKPVECRNYKCWEAHDESMPITRPSFLIQLGWDGEIAHVDKEYVAENL